MRLYVPPAVTFDSPMDFSPLIFTAVIALLVVALLVWIFMMDRRLK